MCSYMTVSAFEYTEQFKKYVILIQGLGDEEKFKFTCLRIWNMYENIDTSMLLNKERLENRILH